MIFNPIVSKMETPTYISSLAVGSSVWCEVNGTRTELLIVHQGNPDTSLYDASCDGTWCLFKNIYSKRIWLSSNANNYDASEVNTWLNGDFLGLLNIKNKIKQVKIPYCNEVATWSVKSGAEGLSCSVFLLSGKEVGASYDVPADGAKLDYFPLAAPTAQESKRIATFDGANTAWWLRSQMKTSNNSVVLCSNNGMVSSSASYGSQGIRPAFILPSDAKIDKDNNIVVDVAPPAFEPETWVIKNNWTPVGDQMEATIKFTSNNIEYTRFYNKVSGVNNVGLNQYSQTSDLTYGYTVVCSCSREATTSSGVSSASWGYYSWTSQANRTIIFTEESPSGNLLTWLQANAVKQ